MNRKNKFVFESFQDFVEQVLEKVKTGELNEEEGYTSLISLANKIIGDLKLRGEAKTMASGFFAEMSKYVAQIPGDKPRADAIKRIQDDVETIAMTITDLPDNESKGVLDPSTTGWKREYVEGTYSYCYAGTVLATDFPYFGTDGEVQSIDGDGPVNLYLLLGAINAWNLDTMSGQNASGSSMLQPFDHTGKFKFLVDLVKASNNMDVLSIEDLDVNTINVVTNPASKFMSTNEETKGVVVSIPLYSVAIFQPGAGEPIAEEMIEEVIKPAGTSIEVVDKKHSSEGVDFFAENEVKISEAGIKAIKAMLSVYNDVTKILVNGAASSKPTSRAGGNEQLAQDRRKAGIDALNALKKTVPQLKNAEILEGSAEVQQGTKEESDPKMQQVSFVVSGTAKKSEVIDNKEVKITKIENIKGDNIRLWKNMLSIGVTFPGKK